MENWYKEEIEKEYDKVIQDFKTARTNAKISHKYIAKISGASQPSVTRFENKKTKVSLLQFMKYLDAIEYEIELKKRGK